MAVRVLGNREFDAKARYQAYACGVNVVDMQRGCVGVTILSVMLIKAMIVKKLMGVMRVPDRCILMGVQLHRRNTGNYDGD